MVLNQHELAILGGGQFAPVYPGQFRPVLGGQFQPMKVVSLLRPTMVNFTGFSTLTMLHAIKSDRFVKDYFINTLGPKYRINI